MFIYTIFIKPLELLFEIIYVLAYRITQNYGISIICLSLAMNLLALPLYKQADSMQKEHREKEKKLEKWTAHIKQTFKGEEQFMMMGVYNRQNSYGPLDPLKGAIPLLLEVPFFIAAYHFLSSVTFFSGVSFGLIKDLSMPDGLFHIFGKSINVLPLLMTLLNIFSGLVYIKESGTRYLRQIVITAGVFLLLLYNSASALALYWTLNNLFSLIKNIIMMKKRSTDVKGYEGKSERKQSVIVILSGVLLSVFVGLYIPTMTINASPEEFIDISYIINPMSTVGYVFALAMGVFIVWNYIIFIVLPHRIQGFYALAAFFAAVGSIINFMCFDAFFGNISTKLGFVRTPRFTLGDICFNLFILVLLFAGCVLIFKKFRRLIYYLLSILIIVFSAMIIMNSGVITDSYNGVFGKLAKASGEPQISLSRDGQNVVVIMMDCLMGRFIPYIMNEKQELYEKFSGFTYYPNTVSFGAHTNVGTPALYGGYDYVPEEMNKRDRELLKDKQNEALKVMPVIFLNNGYKVTVCDPTYANYEWVPDLSIYDDYPEIKRYITNGIVGADSQSVKNDEILLRRNMFMYSLFKVAPKVFRTMIYDEGSYWQADTCRSDYINESFGQKREELSRSYGYNRTFMKAYKVLEKLPEITDIQSKKSNTFVMMSNDTPHETTLLQEPDYIPAEYVDNTEYDQKNPGRYASDGSYVALDKRYCAIRYQVCMAAMLKLGEWMDYLKSEGVYDNTRIIIVSDHGYNLWNTPELEVVSGEDEKTDLTMFNCTLLVKDYNDKVFKVDTSFMTNADVPSIATADLVPDAHNPFTGNGLYDKNNKIDGAVVLNSYFDITENNGYKFAPGDWFHVNSDISDIKNWQYLGEY